MTTDTSAATLARDDASGPDTALVSDGGIRVWLEPPGILRVTLPENAAVTGAHAESVADLVRQLAADRRYPLLLDLTGATSVSREARKVYCRAASVCAYALLGHSPVDRVLAHFFLGTERPMLPSKFFTSEAEALAWLERHACLD
ncbi:STAS/SEC14 domain-containing protein [Specibacter cremeus]|uniref:DUF7793 family protein n=1 Tax=Specibacter cremeus TaxID=1629051 RepID=UPI000F79418E|nr:STAS/SEC14 domain-containing protein [Specibacter cremeus]